MIENDINDDTLKLPLCNGLAEVNLPIYGLCYKHMMSINYAPSVVNKLKALLTDDIRVVIYNRLVFIVQATGVRSHFYNLFLPHMISILSNFFNFVYDTLNYKYFKAKSEPKN
jgi:hypothetical protein